MDSPPFEHLGRFLERIKNVGFFERIFSWKTIVSLGYDAYGEYQQIQETLRRKDQEISELTTKVRDLGKDLEQQSENASRLQQNLVGEQQHLAALNDRVTDKETQRAKLEATLSETQTNTDATILRLKEELVGLKAKNEELTRKINERENEAGSLAESDKKNRETIVQMRADISASETKYELLNMQFIEAQKVLAEFRQKEEERIREHDQRITELNSLKKQLDDDRLRVQQERDLEIHKKFEEMEQTWKKHEEVVEQSLRSICQRHTIEYCDKEKFPFSTKKPDNAVIIADQYVIFDAKSPKNSEELTNFPLYIKSQAEAAKKYAKEDNVKKDIFLVVPANTVDYLEDFHLDMADYQVYIVTLRFP